MEDGLKDLHMCKTIYTDEPEEMIEEPRLSIQPGLYQNNPDYRLQNYPTDFKVQEFESLIKVQDCSYVNESKKAEEFYHCPCSEDFSPICKGCAESCHSSHNPVSFGTGNFECTCGRGNHIVQVYKADSISPCFYKKFFTIIPHKMNNPNYEAYNESKKDEKTLCAVCEIGCKRNGLTLSSYKEKIITGLIPGIKEDSQQVKSLKACLEAQNKECNCKDNHNFNPIQINGKFLQRKELKDKMLNFNFNIMFKIQQTKKLYIESLNDSILQYISKKSSQSNIDFFSSWINFKTLEMCSLCLTNWKTKYTSICPFLYGLDPNELLHLLNLPDDFNTKFKSENLDLNFFTSKLYFAELLFNYFIKSILVKTNNLFSMKTILNMTLHQRLLYIHQAKNFYLFSQESNQKLKEWDLIDNVAKEILALFKKIKECETLEWKYFDTAFTTFNRIMKYLIKFNLISKDQRAEYLDILLDTLQLFLKKKGTSLKNTILSIVKTLVYCIIYANDERAFKIAGIGPVKSASEKQEKTKFAFIINDYNMKVSKVFLHIIQHKNEDFTVSQKLQYDYCVKKVNELMLFTRDSYCFSLCKTNFDKNDLLQHYDNSKSDFYPTVRSQINNEAYEKVKGFMMDLSYQSQNYFQYESSYVLYLNNIIELFSKFRDYYHDPQSSRFQPINNDSEYIELKENNRGSSFQHHKDLFYGAVKIFPFFQRIDELIYIFAKGKEYHPHINSKVFEEMNEVILLIIEMYGDLLKSDNSLITILMNTKPDIFIEAIHLCNVNQVFSLLNQMADICISNIQYQAYDSFYFFTGCIRHLLKLHHSDLLVLPHIIKFSSKIMRKSFQKEESFLTNVEDYSTFFLHLGKRRKDFKEFFNKDNKFTPEQNNQYSDFYCTYFGFLSNLMDYDIFFFNYLHDEIVDIDDVYKVVFDNPNMNFELVSQVMRYYFLKKLSFNFKITSCFNEMKTLFKPQFEEIKDSSIPFINLWQNNDRLKIDTASMQMIIDTLISFIGLFNERIEKENIGTEILFTAYEHTIVRPIFKLINLSYLKIELLTGIYQSNLYNLILVFIDFTIKLYKKETYTIAEHDFSVKDQLNNNEKEELIIIREKLKDNVKYFELEKMIKCFSETIKIINRKVDNDSDTETQGIIQQLLHLEDVELDLSTDDPNYYQILLVSKYLEHKKKRSDDQLVLIKSFYLLESEIEIDVRSHIITYFCDKFFSSITERSKAMCKSDYEVYEIKNVKMQNVYSLLFLNKYFSHDCHNFQSRFMQMFLGESYETKEKCKGKKYLDLFLTCLSLNIIFPCILNEIEKIYSLDIFADTTIGKSLSISYKSGKYSLKFIQNICEGYNTENQSYLFGSRFAYQKIDDDDDNKDSKEIIMLSNQTYQSYYDNYEEIEQQNLYDYLSFFNFLCCTMRLINQNLYHRDKIQRILFKKLLTNLNSLGNIKGLHIGLSDLIVEMIQGTNTCNYDLIYTDLSLIKDPSLKKDKMFLSTDFFNCDIIKGKLHYSIEDLKGFQTREVIKRKMMESNKSSRIMKIMNTAVTDPKKEQEQEIKQEPEEAESFTRKSSALIGSKKRGKRAQSIHVKEIKDIKILFQLMMSIFETRDILNDEYDILNQDTLNIKVKIFIIINNIINQDSVNQDIIEFLAKIFNMSKLMDISGLLLKILYCKWVEKTPLRNHTNFKFDSEHFEELSNEYITDEVLFKDNFFKLVSQIYLFITIMGEKYNKPEAKEIIKYKEKLQDNRNQQQTGNKILAFIKSFFTHKKKKEENDTNLDEKYYVCMFLGTFIKKVEFKEQNSDMKLLTLHFVVDPHSFYISDSSKKNFLSNVDRKSSTTKLTALINAMDIFMEEIEENNNMQLNYNSCIKYNFIFSLAVNFLMLFFLNGLGTEQKILRLITALMIITQLLCNLFLILVFLITKYSFHVKMIKKKYKARNKRSSPWTYLKVYFIESYLLNDDIFLVNFVFVLGLLGLISKYPLFFYVSQLLIVIAFVPTIKEIVIAFQIRFGQLFCMIGFLLILLYFYANIGFYFYIGEFNAVVETVSDNYCQTMMECTLTYFNHGVRSGGGIGDVLGDKEFSPAGLYYLRLVTDMIFYITVILLLLNMINGVIVSTFSQIREESSAKEEDEQNKCFICNIGRKAFEKRKIDFDKHREEEHNINTYIDFFVMLKRMNEKDLDKVQAEINDCLKKKETYSFPVKLAKGIDKLEDGEEED